MTNKKRPSIIQRIFRHRSATEREDFWTGLICLTPTAVIMLVFVIFPVVFSFYLSFHQWNILRPEKPFVGLDNYVRMFHTDEFWASLKNTLLYTVGVVPIGATVSLLIALFLNQKIRALSFYRTVYFLPVVTSTIVQIILDQMPYGVVRPNIPAYAAASREIGLAVEEVVFGNLDPKTQLDIAAEKVNEMLQQ